MVIQLSDLIRMYSLKITGVLHIGAHYGEEYLYYKKNGIKKMIFFEPLPDNFRHLLDNLKPDFPELSGYPDSVELISADKRTNIQAKRIALGNSTGVLPMFVETANQSQSSSLLKPRKHLEQYPHITFDSQIEVNLDKLDNITIDKCFNTINIDVQGFELEVFKGGLQTLGRQIDYIYTEVNRDELYENCARVEQLDSFLGKLGFKRMITNWIGGSWGDALYIKADKAPSAAWQAIIRFYFSPRGQKLRRMFIHDPERGSRRLYKLIKWSLKPRMGQKRHQQLFESLFMLSLSGMNYGSSDLECSGEKQVINLIKQMNPPPKELLVFDVGANVGSYTNLLLEQLGNRAKIFAFEPSRQTFQTLAKNIGSQSNVRLLNLGLGNAKGILTLYTDSPDSGIASVYKRNLQHLKIDLNQTEEIEIDTLDTFCAANGISHIHLLKIDVEGHELKVLEGASRMLENKAIDFIQFEFGGTQIDSRTFFRDFFYLLKDGYTLHRIVKDGIVPLEEYSEFLEVFSMVNFLAIKR